MSTQHQFELVVSADETVTSVPSCSEAEIFVGDMARFFSSFGAVQITWTENVFDSPVYEEGMIAKVVSAGRFAGSCTFTQPGGKTMTWKGSGLEGQSKDIDPD